MSMKRSGMRMQHREVEGRMGVRETCLFNLDKQVSLKYFSLPNAIEQKLAISALGPDMNNEVIKVQVLDGLFLVH